MLVPVHASHSRLKYLHPVHTYVPYAVVQVFGVYSRQGDKPSAIFGPAFEYRQLAQVGLFHHNLLASAAAIDHFGHP